MQAKNIVEPEHAHDWIKNNVVGRITQKDLDQNRHKEVNGLDMMQNSCIVYHSESILEMQIMCLIGMFIIEERLNWYDYDRPEIRENFYLCIILLGEHLFSYICTYYRKQELLQRGQPDVNGILRAKNESILGTIEIFVDCILFGYIIKYLVETETIHDHPFYFYWIIFDCLIMFFSLAYNYFS